jgi:tetratricopeptide (TPR) repeat protein
VSRSIAVERVETAGGRPAPAADGSLPAAEPPADGGPAARFRPGDVLRADALAYFLGRLREADAAGHTTSVAAAAAAARGEFDVVLRELDGADSASLPVAFLKGLATFANGDVEASAGQFRTALRAASDFMPATFYLGACYASSGRDEQAVAAWQTTLLAERGAPIVYEALADAWLRLQDGGQAAAVLTTALEQWPGDERFVRRMAAARALPAK